MEDMDTKQYTNKELSIVTKLLEASTSNPKELLKMLGIIRCAASECIYYNRNSPFNCGLRDVVLHKGICRFYRIGRQNSSTAHPLDRTDLPGGSYVDFVSAK